MSELILTGVHGEYWCYRYTTPIPVPNVLLHESQQCKNAVADIQVTRCTKCGNWGYVYVANVPSHGVEVNAYSYSKMPGDKLHLLEWGLAGGETIPLDWRQWLYFH